jgi:hypothetical protein
VLLLVAVLGLVITWLAVMPTAYVLTTALLLDIAAAVVARGLIDNALGHDE